MIKSLFPLLLLFLSSTFAFAQPVTEGLAAYYPFDDASPNDLSGNGNNGIITGQVILVPDRNGVDNSAISLQLVNQFLLLGKINADLFDTDKSFTISLWYQDNSTDTTSYKTIFYKDEMGLPTTPNSLSFGLYNNKMAFDQCQQTTDTIDNTKWNHVVFTYEQGERRMYINCVEECSSNSEFARNNAAIHLGQGYKGAIDDLIFYDRVLTNEEISLLFGGECFLLTNLNPPLDKPSFRIFPTPATDQLTVESEYSGGQYRLIDLLGRNWLTVAKQNNRQPIDLQSLPKGIYYLQYLNNGQILETQPVVKQ